MSWLEQCTGWSEQCAVAVFEDADSDPRLYRDKGFMAMIGHGSAVAAIGKKRHELDGAIAFAAWLGVHALLMTGVRARIEAFIDWDWNHFDRSPIQVLDRSDEKRIDWDRGSEGERSRISPAARTARRLRTNIK